MIRAFIGGQTGSEAKGSAVYYLRNRYEVHVRVGAPNAGHSAWDHGRKWALQSIPVGVFNPEATLVIGAGGLIDPETLTSEVAALAAAGHNPLGRLLIDQNCGVVTRWHKDKEGFVDGEPHRTIGSTGKGVGLARMSKISRGTMGDELGVRAVVAGRALRDTVFAKCLRKNTRSLLQEAHLQGASICLEGAQGWGLSLDHGPWPYVTSANCGAAQLASDTGLPPQHVRCTVVLRSFPIRVAGNSGPFTAGEASWEELGVDPQSELTTVTKKVRRVGYFSSDDAIDAVRSNGADSFCLMCLDQRFPEITGATTALQLAEHDSVAVWLDGLRRQLGVPLWLVGTSPTTIVEFEFPEDK